MKTNCEQLVSNCKLIKLIDKKKKKKTNKKSEEETEKKRKKNIEFFLQLLNFRIFYLLKFLISAVLEYFLLNLLIFDCEIY